MTSEEIRERMRQIGRKIRERDASILEGLGLGPACDDPTCCPLTYLPKEKRVYSGDRPA